MPTREPRYFFARTAKKTPDPASAITTAATSANIQFGPVSKFRGNLATSAPDSEGGVGSGATMGAIVGNGVAIDVSAVVALEATGGVVDGAVDSLVEVVGGSAAGISAGTRFWPRINPKMLNRFTKAVVIRFSASTSVGS